MTPQHRRNIAAQINARMSKRTIDGPAWKDPALAPRDTDLEVQCRDPGGDYVMPGPCRLTESGWIVTRSGKRLASRVVGWRVRGW
jgi:hypothetical protein